jgi:two-component system, cell cycle response regulator
MSRSKPQSPTAPMTDAEALGRAVAASLIADRKPFLVVLSGDEVGARRRLGDGAEIGRDPECAFVLRDASSSWRHARFELRGADVWVVDLGSTNGTMLNGSRIERARVLPGDKVIVGNTVLRLDLLDAIDCEFQGELERLLDIDDLTGLWAKRRFDAEADALVRAAVVSGEPVAVMMMDLDGIKAINDANGHAFGAYVIAESGALIGRVIGGRGFATRWGGDEFSAVLPGLDLAAGERVGEEILAAIGAHAYVREGRRLHPGISIGVAAGARDGDDLEVLQRWADEALYQAKRAGRGRVSIAER